MKNQIMAIAIAATMGSGMGLGLTSASAEEGKSSGWQIGGVRFANPIDPSTWWEGPEAKHKETMVLNFTDPDFWMQIPTLKPMRYFTKR